MGSYWMRKARRGQLENAGHFAVLVACRLRSPIALSEEESQRVVVQVIDALRLRRLQEAIVARPFLCRFSYSSIFRAKIVLQNSFFFSNGRFGSCLLERQTGASPVPPSLAIFFLQIGFPRCSAFFLSFLSFFLYYVLFFAEARVILSMV
jgi:hypothetical protein